jgi:penicillin amidase
MSPKLRRLLLTILSVIVVLALVMLAVGLYLPRASFPRTSGEVKLDGLDSTVDIYRDDYGIPHIYAQTSHDLIFTQGYVHAQDRFWQMDFWRHIGSARLSEMFGESQLDTDIFLRTLGWARVVQQELDAMPADELALLQAYADGVNAYLADHKGAALSLEYAILKLLTPDYSPEPWQPLNTLTWGKAMAWSLGEGQLFYEVEHAILSKTLTPEQIADLFPPYPSDHPLIVPDFSINAPSGSAVQHKEINTLADLSLPFQSFAANLAKVERTLGPSGGDIGSNSWAIAGSLTTTGKPFLANDMHLAEQMPSIWYEIGLHCTPKGPDCPYNVVGFSFAGTPGVIVGHNDKIAWGFTNVDPDILDLYIEKINPDNPNQYEVNGEWVDMSLVNETIQVAGLDPVELTVRYTRHGPVIWDDPESQMTTQESWGIDLPTNYAISVRWTALEPVNMFKAVFGMDSAQNWDEYRQAVVYFSVPSQNAVYADIDGNIGYYTLGNIPMRKSGHSGLYPVPGWTDDYEWQGYIPFDQLPNAFNPPEGYIATANNAIIDTDYPYSITTIWDSGFRADRIVEMLESAPGPIDAAYIQQIHGDDYNGSAAYLMPLLTQLNLEDEHQIAVRELLTGWDYQNHMDLVAPAIYNAFWRATMARTYNDELPEDYWPDGGDIWFEILRRLVQNPNSGWWDDVNTTGVETRDDILSLAFSDAVAEVEQILGKDTSRWNWGDLHSVIFHNQSLGTSGVGPIEAIFNRGPYPASGGSSIVNATSWDASETDPVKAYQVTWLPSERMIVDFSNLPASLSQNTTGESGHAFHPHYDDQIDMWRTIQYHPMLWEQAQVESAAKDHLVLTPYED